MACAIHKQIGTPPRRPKRAGAGHPSRAKANVSPCGRCAEPGCPGRPPTKSAFITHRPRKSAVGHPALA
eukprot:2000626-Lingulodinium_polyedra.AAC.1